MKMNISALKYIVAVDTYRNFVKAAKACGVTQPSLSMAIRALEEELDVTIFNRDTHPVQATQMGRRIINQAKLVLRHYECIEEMVMEEKISDRGGAVLGIIPTVAPYILPELFMELRSRYPQFLVKVAEMRSSFMVDKLLSYELDLAIMATPLNHPSLLEVPLYYEKFVAYVSDEDELAVLKEIPSDRLMSPRLWVLEEGHCLKNQVFNLCSAESLSNTDYQAGSISTLIRIVDVNGGYTVIPEMHIPQLSEESKHKVRHIVIASGEAEPVREISLVFRKDFIRERQLNIIADCIKNIVPSHMLDTRLKRFAIRL